MAKVQNFVDRPILHTEPNHDEPQLNSQNVSAVAAEAENQPAEKEKAEEPNLDLLETQSPKDDKDEQ